MSEENKSKSQDNIDKCFGKAEPVFLKSEEIAALKKEFPASELWEKELKSKLKYYLKKGGIFEDGELVESRKIILNNIRKEVTLYSTFYKGKPEDKNKRIIEKFKSPDILREIFTEISKDHIGDDKLKMTAYLTAISGLMKLPEMRQSLRLGSYTSEGKDNLIKSILKHIPHKFWFYVTSATEATIQDDLKDYPILAFSEINLFKEGGANKILLEVLKQRTEGGTKVAKKDKRTDQKTLRVEEAEQGSVIFGTTDTREDEEFNTRYLSGRVEATPKRIEMVNNKTLLAWGAPEILIKNVKKEPSWLSLGIEALDRDLIPYFPFANLLTEKVNDKNIFDNSTPRSQRDVKRLMSLAGAVVWLKQKQRKIIEHNGAKFIEGEPQDLIDALLITEEFFQGSYEGMDNRLSKLLGMIGDSWTARDDLQRKMGVARNTIKDYCTQLSEKGVIEGSKGCQLNQERRDYFFDDNKIYFKRCQKGVKRVLIGCQLKELIDFLEKKTNKSIIIDSIFTDDKIQGCQKKGVKITEVCPENEKKDEKKGKIDTFSLTPFNYSAVGEALSEHE